MPVFREIEAQTQRIVRDMEVDEFLKAMDGWPEIDNPHVNSGVNINAGDDNSRCIYVAEMPSNSSLGQPNQPSVSHSPGSGILTGAHESTTGHPSALTSILGSTHMVLTASQASPSVFGVGSVATRLNDVTSQSPSIVQSYPTLEYATLMEGPCYIPARQNDGIESLLRLCQIPESQQLPPAVDERLDHSHMKGRALQGYPLNWASVIPYNQHLSLQRTEPMTSTLELNNSNGVENDAATSVPSLHSVVSPTSAPFALPTSYTSAKTSIHAPQHFHFIQDTAAAPIPSIAANIISTPISMEGDAAHVLAVCGYETQGSAVNQKPNTPGILDAFKSRRLLYDNESRGIILNGQSHTSYDAGKEYAFLVPANASTLQRASSSASFGRSESGVFLKHKHRCPAIVRTGNTMSATGTAVPPLVTKAGEHGVEGIEEFKRLGNVDVAINKSYAHLSALAACTCPVATSLSPISTLSSPYSSLFFTSSLIPPASSAPISATETTTTAVATTAITETPAVVSASPSEFYFMEPYQYSTDKFDRRCYNSRKELKLARATALKSRRSSRGH